MDRKSISILILSVALLLCWPYLINRLWPPTRLTPQALAHAAATNRPPAATNVIATPTPGSNQPPALVAGSTNAEPEQLVVIENAEARYTFTSHGGGLKLVELKDYPEHVSRRQSRQPGERRLASLNTSAPLPVLAITGSEAVEGDGVFKLSTNGPTVRAEKALPSGLVVVKEFQLKSNYLLNATARLENRSAQTLELPTQEWVAGTSTPLDARDDGMLLGVFWHNGRSAEHVGPSWFANRTLGCFPGTPRYEYAQGQTNVGWAAVHNQFFALAVMPPTNVAGLQAVVRETPLPPVRAGTPAPTPGGKPAAGSDWLLAASDLTDAAALALKLRAAQEGLGRYFYDRLSTETKAALSQFNGSREVPEPLIKALVTDLNRVLEGASLYQENRDYYLRVMLSEPTRRVIQQARWLEDAVRINRLLLQEAFAREIHKSPMGYQASVAYPPATLAANQSLERQFLIFAGPKEYKTLSRLGERLGNDIDLVMEYGGFFGFFAKLLLLSMNGLHALAHSVGGFDLGYGWIIILITVIIKAVFWPLTNLSTRSMKRMAALQPQMKAIQEKYKDDPQKMQRKTWEFYKEHKINPASGCLPVLVQMPIFFGFYQMIRSAIELRGATFLWITDLSKPDTLFMIPGMGWFPFIGVANEGLPFNLLPLVMGVTMLWQARLTPVTPGADPMQQKMMKYMPLMFLVMLYNFSAGLTLYWTVQNLLSIAQMKLTRAVSPAAASPAKPAAAALPPRKKK
jgi:YidC/Oxa1 family membrane protein insertase